MYLFGVEFFFSNFESYPFDIIRIYINLLDSESSNKKKPRVSLSMDLDESDSLETKDNRERSPSPPKNDISAYLHIENLVRPFTINQLKGLIRKTGTISESGFWINNIKSHCYAQVCKYL